MRVVVLALCLAACRSHFDVPSDAANAGNDTGSNGDGPPSPTAVRVIVQGHGVALVAGQQPCASQCDYDVGAIDITTWAGEAWQFTTFSNQCGTAASCTVQPGSTVTLTFTRAPITANLFFVSSTTSPRGSLAALDSTCTSLASAAGFGGTFVAYASTSTVDAVTRLGSARGWVRVDGLPLFDMPADFSSSQSPRAVALDEKGAVHSDPIPTGTFANGTKDTSGTCNDWTSMTGQSNGGWSDWSGTYRFSFVGPSCSSLWPVYCVETDRNVAVSIVPAAAPMGRYVFVTPTSYAVGGGIAAADARCNNEATAAGLPGTYAAVLATSTVSAADHLGGVGGMWRRPDGVVVSFNGLDQDPLDAAIDRAANGMLAGGNDVLFGSVGTLTALGTATCADWTDSAAVSRFDIFSLSTRPFLRGGSPPGCASPARLMCAQLP